MTLIDKAAAAQLPAGSDQQPVPGDERSDPGHQLVPVALSGRYWRRE